ncbi:MAG: hypothetical protein NTV54_10010, partial [Ignavibacteriales bacterium]|nr:hypothetical protein [Ignavibacteriales bacterium]
ERIKRGESAHVSLEIFNDRHKHLIQPMPGVLIFLSLVKGWLGEEAALLVNPLISAYEQKTGTRYNGPDTDAARERLLALGTHFKNRPMKTAIVTSSIFYEADIVMQEVFSVLSSQLEGLPISEKRKEIIRQRLSHYRNVYDAFITASDSSEIRLKPHRDLYSIALHHLNIPKKEFDTVIGFEDSESGTIAIRAAGIGLCVAVPFAQTSGHNLTAAAHVCRGGLPETLLMHNLFMMS